MLTAVTKAFIIHYTQEHEHTGSALCAGLLHRTRIQAHQDSHSTSGLQTWTACWSTSGRSSSYHRSPVPPPHMQMLMHDKVKLRSSPSLIQLLRGASVLRRPLSAWLPRSNSSAQQSMPPTPLSQPRPTMRTPTAPSSH